MRRPSWFFLALGCIAFLTIGAVTNQIVPLDGSSGITLDPSGVGFPDGTFQTTAFPGSFTGPAEVFYSSCHVTSSTATSTGRCQLPLTVPAGKRLVIETVTGYGYSQNIILGSAYLSHSAAGLGTTRTSFPWAQQINPISDRRYFGFNHFVHLYADGPATLQFDVAGATSSGTSSYSLDYTVSGYLVDLSAR
jgi:hypothetical protein